METLPVKRCNHKEDVDRLVRGFRDEFPGVNPEAVIRVPGRVNLIGEHIDYCGFAVHPMAIDRHIFVVVGRKSGGKLSLFNENSQRYAPFEADNIDNALAFEKGRPEWWKYFLCGLKGIREEHGPLVGTCCYVAGSIPPSAGLSSSSAIVVSAALTGLFTTDKVSMVSRKDLADLCARSERFIGTQGGGMDQAIELLAEAGSAKLIEFNPLTATGTVLPNGCTFIIANSLAESSKAAGQEFNRRVVECRLACQIMAKELGLDNWKTMLKFKAVEVASKLTLHELAERAGSILHEDSYTREEVGRILAYTDDDFDRVLTDNTRDLSRFKLNQRARHVFSEAARVYDFHDACGSADRDALGRLMSESHSSCRDLYECSHPQLDNLVELAKKHGAVGARLTGAGWGGCIVALVPSERVDKVMGGLQKDYFDKVLAARGMASTDYLFPTQPGPGAFIYTL